MGLSWQQGPLGGATVGRFLTPEPLPQRLLFAEPLRRRMRVKLAGEWIVDSEDVILLRQGVQGVADDERIEGVVSVVSGGDAPHRLQLHHIAAVHLFQ